MCDRSLSLVVALSLQTALNLMEHVYVSKITRSTLVYNLC